MKILGCVIGFNEEAMLERCFKSLRPLVDTLVFVDGAYKSFPHNEAVSTDNTRSIAQDYADIIIHTRVAWEDEVQKRNAYLVGNPGDFYFVLDADEELIYLPDFSLWNTIVKQGQEDYLIDIHRGTLPVMSLCSRVFQHRRGIHYSGAHNALWLGERLLNNEKQALLDSCFIQHYMDERDIERIEAKGTYYRHLQNYEREFRRQHRI